jgi:hypothetical protein
LRIFMTGLLLASQAARLAHRRRRFARASVTLPVASTTHQNKTRPKTYPRSLRCIYYARVRSTEGAVMRRHASGIGCGARGREGTLLALPGGAGAPPGDTTIPCEELADGGPQGLPEVLRRGRPKGASVERARRQGETARQKARPGAAKTPRWRAERRHTFARRCD